MKKVSLFEIFGIFFIIGAQLIGGGYVILPLLRHYIVEQRKWITEEELIDYFAVSQCLPGLIASNISVFTGYKARKTLGAIVATIGVILPSFLAILLLANLLLAIVDNKIVLNAFWGIRISVIILIILTIRDMWKQSVHSKFSYAMYILILLALIFFPVSPAVIIISSALIAISYSNIMKGRKND